MLVRLIKTCCVVAQYDSEKVEVNSQRRTAALPNKNHFNTSS
jgi:hypothetical protein